MYDKDFTYRVQAIEPGDKLPIECKYTSKKYLMLMAAALLQIEHPKAKVSAVRQKAFVHGKAMRWLFEHGALNEVSWFDETRGTLPLDGEYTSTESFPIAASRNR